MFSHLNTQFAGISMCMCTEDNGQSLDIINMDKVGKPQTVTLKYNTMSKDGKS